MVKKRNVFIRMFQLMGFGGGAVLMSVCFAALTTHSALANGGTCPTESVSPSVHIQPAWDETSWISSTSLAATIYVTDDTYYCSKFAEYAVQVNGTNIFSPAVEAEIQLSTTGVLTVGLPNLALVEGAGNAISVTYKPVFAGGNIYLYLDNTPIYTHTEPAPFAIRYDATAPGIGFDGGFGNTHVSNTVVVSAADEVSGIQSWTIEISGTNYYTQIIPFGTVYTWTPTLQAQDSDVALTVTATDRAGNSRVVEYALQEATSNVIDGSTGYIEIGDVSVEVPPQGGVVSMTLTTTVPYVHPSYKLMRGFTLSAFTNMGALSTLTNAMTVTISYDPNDLSGVNAPILFYVGSGSMARSTAIEWVRMPSVVNKAAATVTAHLTRMGAYALLAAPMTTLQIPVSMAKYCNVNLPALQADDCYEPNNWFTQTYSIATGVIYTGAVYRDSSAQDPADAPSAVDRRDFYDLALTAGISYSMHLAPLVFTGDLTGDVDLFLYTDAASELWQYVARSTHTAERPEEISVCADASRRYIVLATAFETSQGNPKGYTLRVATHGVCTRSPRAP